MVPQGVPYRFLRLSAAFGRRGRFPRAGVSNSPALVNRNDGLPSSGRGIDSPATRRAKAARSQAAVFHYFKPASIAPFRRRAFRANSRGGPRPALSPPGGPRPSSASPLPLVAPSHGGSGFGRVVSARCAGVFIGWRGRVPRAFVAFRDCVRGAPLSPAGYALGLTWRVASAASSGLSLMGARALISRPSSARAFHPPALASSLNDVLSFPLKPFSLRFTTRLPLPTSASLVFHGSPLYNIVQRNEKMFKRFSSWPTATPPPTTRKC